MRHEVKGSGLYYKLQTTVKGPLGEGKRRRDSANLLDLHHSCLTTVGLGNACHGAQLSTSQSGAFLLLSASQRAQDP